MGSDNVTGFLHPITPHGISDSGIGTVSGGKGPSADLHPNLGPRSPCSSSPSGQHLSSTYFLCFGHWPLQVLLDPFSLPVCPDQQSTFVFSSVNASRYQHARNIQPLSALELRLYSLTGLRAEVQGGGAGFSAQHFTRLKSKSLPVVTSPGTWSPLPSSFLLLARFSSFWL